MPVNGRSLLAAGWVTLRADKELLTLPALGTIISLIPISPLVGALYYTEGNMSDPLFLLTLALSTFLTAFVYSFFAVALACGANTRMGGGDPTVGSSLAAAWAKRAPISQWSALTAAVSLLLRFIEQKVPVAGKFISALGGLTWEVGTYFVVPIIATEEHISGTGAVKRSAETLRTRWMNAVRVELRTFVLVLAVVTLTVIQLVAGFYFLDTSVPTAAVLLTMAALTAIGGTLLISAVSSIARVALYRYATNRPTPGFDTDILANAIR